MAIRNLNWYNLQTTRRYPLSDRATGETDDGRNLPNNIIVDCNLTTTGDILTPFFSAVTVSDGIVTVAISSGNETIGVVAVPKPIDTNRHYTIQPVRDGTVGWVVFGYGVAENFSGKFSTPEQSALNSRAYAFWDPPVTAAGVDEAAAALTGLINLEFDEPFSYRVETVRVDQTKEEYYPALIVGLDKNLVSADYDPESYFLADCGKRPESGTCPQQPIVTINGVYPDCAGDIKISFDGFIAGAVTKLQETENENGETVVEEVCDGAIVVGVDYGFNDVCAEPETKIPNFFTDNCCPLTFSSLTERDSADIQTLEVGSYARVVNGSSYDYYKVRQLTDTEALWTTVDPSTDAELANVLKHCDWPDPTTLINAPVFTLESRSDYPEINTPICVDFCSCADSAPYIDFVSGSYNFEIMMAPPVCPACGQTDTGDSEQEENFSTQERHKVLRFSPTVDLGIGLLKASKTDWSVGKTISTKVYLTDRGHTQRAGIIFNYAIDETTGVDFLQYYTLMLDAQAAELRLSYWANGDETALAETDAGFRAGRWYQLSVTPVIRGAIVYIAVQAHELNLETGRDIRIGGFSGVPISLEQYEPLTGALGLVSDGAESFFSELRVI